MWDIGEQGKVQQLFPRIIQVRDSFCDRLRRSATLTNAPASHWTPRSPASPGRRQFPTPQISRDPLPPRLQYLSHTYAHNSIARFQVARNMGFYVGQRIARC